MPNSFQLTKNFNSNVPDWNSIINNFNYSLSIKDAYKHICPGFFVSHNAEHIDKVKPIMVDLKCRVAHLYFNIGLGPTFGKHKDNVDVYFWQCQGIAHWLIDGEKIILEPGDLLIIKKGVYHEVIPKTPRAGISMSKQ
tara:strand:+ start:697 stop:1110 length:414 start_codon:yes stop_codon:yes gene_type:complete